jgi:hypothetical protein
MSAYQGLAAPASAPAQQQPLLPAAQAKQQRQEQQGQSKKQRKPDLAREAVSRLHQACKQQRSREVLALFEEALAAGLALQQGLYNTVLYQAACGEAWERLARRAAGQPPSEASAAAPDGGCERPCEPPCEPPLLSAEDVEYVTSKAGGICDAMLAKGWALDEVGYTAMGRVALLRGRAEEAMAWAARAGAAGLPVRLRSYHPALVGAALAGDAGTALRVRGAACLPACLPACHAAGCVPRRAPPRRRAPVAPHPQSPTRPLALLPQVLDTYSQAGLDLTELELRYMLEAVSKGGSYPQFTRLAALLTDNLNALEPATARHAADFFRGAAAAGAAQDAVEQAAAEAAHRRQQEAQHGNQQQQEEAQQQQAQQPAGPGQGPGSSGAAPQHNGWHVSEVAVLQDGSCPAAGGRLRVVELQDEE